MNSRTRALVLGLFLAALGLGALAACQGPETAPRQPIKGVDTPYEETQQPSGQ